jgi:hypothetical protein
LDSGWLRGIEQIMSFRLRCCGAVVLLAASTATVSLCQKLSAPQKTVWFVLTEEFGSNGKLVLDPLAIISGGKLSKVLDNCSDDGPAYKSFLAEYLNAGHCYSVAFGRSAAGITVVSEKDRDSLAPSVDYRGAARIHGPVMGLATDSVISQTGMSSRQVPTAAERQSASKLAENLFAKAGVPPDLLAKIKVRNLTHTVLLLSKIPEPDRVFFYRTRRADSANPQSVFHRHLQWYRLCAGIGMDKDFKE